MSKVSDELLQVTDDLQLLTTKTFDVNIRLLEKESYYRKIIFNVIGNMVKCLTDSKFSDYPKLKGISAPNIGIPFNIFIVNFDLGLKVFINSNITSYSKKTVKCKSNCGSINLKESIELVRSSSIQIEFYDINVQRYVTNYFFNKNAFTVQHEYNHCQGLLILPLLEIQRRFEKNL
jgi:peptide deformylase